MGENVEAIFDSGSLRDQAFCLVQWLELRCRLDEYLRHAASKNPFNLGLQNLIRSRKKQSVIVDQSEVNNLRNRMLKLTPSQMLTIMYKSGVPRGVIPTDLSDHASFVRAIVMWAHQNGRLQMIEQLIATQEQDVDLVPLGDRRSAYDQLNYPPWP